MKKIGILYICTGKYSIFWKDFYESSQKYFLNKCEIHYFVFTDSDYIKFEDKKNVKKIYQEQLPWPYITLDRFSIFNNSIDLLKHMDYLFFFNSNMLFVDYVGEELLPDDNFELTFIKHPGFFNKNRKYYTYETNQKSTAYIPDNKGEYYFMGGLNGGKTSSFTKMIKTLDKNIIQDKKNNIIAVWHDESHLNKYAIDNHKKIKILEPIYAYPDGWNLKIDKKIIIRDKNDFGGHEFLRDT